MSGAVGKQLKILMRLQLGYSEEAAQLTRLSRCLNCKNHPCVNGCPVNIHIPEFIQKIKDGDFEGAYQIITSVPPLSRLYAAEFVRRKHSAKANACAVSRASLSASADLRDLLRTGTISITDAPARHSRIKRSQGCGYRFGSFGSYLCRRSCKKRLRGHCFRGSAHGRRRTCIRYSGIQTSQSPSLKRKSKT